MRIWIREPQAREKVGSRVAFVAVYKVLLVLDVACHALQCPKMLAELCSGVFRLNHMYPDSKSG